MTQPRGVRVTELLADWRKGSEEALRQLMLLVHSELRQLASAYMRRECKPHTLQTTALVNETYLRLVGQDQLDWKGRAHFFGIAARVIYFAGLAIEEIAEVMSISPATVKREWTTAKLWLARELGKR